MLPFLKKAKEGHTAGLLIKNRTPDEKPESEDKDDNSAAIEACAHDLISAVHSKDVKAVADAISSAFTILESMPHEEENNDFDSRNEAAAHEVE